MSAALHLLRTMASRLTRYRLSRNTIFGQYARRLAFGEEVSQ